MATPDDVEVLGNLNKQNMVRVTEDAEGVWVEGGNKFILVRKAWEVSGAVGLGSQAYFAPLLSRVMAGDNFKFNGIRAQSSCGTCLPSVSWPFAEMPAEDTTESVAVVNGNELEDALTVGSWGNWPIALVRDYSYQGDSKSFMWNYSVTSAAVRPLGFNVGGKPIIVEAGLVGALSSILIGRVEVTQSRHRVIFRSEEGCAVLPKIEPALNVDPEAVISMCPSWSFSASTADLAAAVRDLKAIEQDRAALPVSLSYDGGSRLSLSASSPCGSYTTTIDCTEQEGSEPWDLEIYRNVLGYAPLFLRKIGAETFLCSCDSKRLFASDGESFFAMTGKIKGA